MFVFSHYNLPLLTHRSKSITTSLTYYVTVIKSQDPLTNALLFTYVSCTLKQLRENSTKFQRHTNDCPCVHFSTRVAGHIINWFFVERKKYMWLFKCRKYTLLSGAFALVQVMVSVNKMCNIT